MSRRPRDEKRSPAKGRPGPHGPTQLHVQPDAPDLLRDVGAALAEGHPLRFLFLVSSLLAVVDPRRPLRFEPTLDHSVPSFDQLVQNFFDADLPEMTAVLAGIAELSGDDMLRHRVRRTAAARAHALPAWLTDLDQATVEGAVEMVHALGDADNIMIGIGLPDGSAMSLVACIDHNLGTLVKNAFVVPVSLDVLVEHMRTVASNDVDMTWADLAPADARVRLHDGIELGAVRFPLLETDTWPACRPLVEWAVGVLPAGGTGYQRPEWDADALAALAERFLGSPFGAGLDDPEHRSLLESLLRFGVVYGPGDPLRWCRVAVAVLLTGWIPSEVVAEPTCLAKAPDLLRAFIRFCHHERGIRPALTAETLAAVDEHEPEYQQTIRFLRPQNPAALLAMMNALYPDGLRPPPAPAPQSFRASMLDTLCFVVGGEDALEKLDADPLPDEPFAWEGVPADVHERVAEVLGLVDRCCDELLDVEYRTACRRFLARAAAAGPRIFRRGGRAETAAAAICWVIGKANDLFYGEMLVKDLVGHFGIGQGSIAQRSQPLLRAIGVDPHHQFGGMALGSPDYLISVRRRRILALRENYLAIDDSGSTR